MPTFHSQNVGHFLQTSLESIFKSNRDLITEYRDSQIDTLSFLYIYITTGLNVKKLCVFSLFQKQFTMFIFIDKNVLPN